MALVTSRYARAFADVVIELKLDVINVREELRSVVKTIESSGPLRRVWDSPAIPHEQKLAVLNSIAAQMGLVSPVRNFIAVLIDHGRVAILPQIARQFETELNQRLGLAEAQVTSCRELSPAEKAALEAQIMTLTAKKVLARYEIDQKILGGAVVKVGSTIYDGSVRGQLQKLREQLSAE
jgi:F-type H+-transporting ATPase subunit delta